MENAWVYVKTVAGEEALRKRTRLAHHDLRQVLIQVDGVSDVAALKNQIGDSQTVENSLLELERLLLIEKRWLPPAAEAKSVPAGGQVARQWLTAWRTRFAAWRRRRRARLDEKAFNRAYAELTPEDAFAPIRIKPIQRGRPARRSGLQRGLALLLILAGVCALLLVVFPYDSYRPEAERRLSLALGVPVRIAHIGFSFRPYPNISLTGIGIGAGQETEIGAIRALPNPFSLLDDVWAVPDLQFEDVLLRDAAIAASARWFGGAGLAVHRLRIERAALAIAGARFDGFGGEMLLDGRGRLIAVRLHDEARKLHLEAAPAEGGYRLSLSGEALPFFLVRDLSVDYVEAQGWLEAGSLRLDKLDARLYGGLATGTARLDWSPTVVLSADVALQHASLMRFAHAYSANLSVEGEMSGKMHVQADADTLTHLAGMLRLGGEFAAERGIIHRFDLMEALRGTKTTRGGSTRFDRLSGQLRCDEKGLQLTGLRIDAGRLQALGKLEVDPAEALQGRLDLDLRGSAVHYQASVGVGGSLADTLLTTQRAVRSGR